MIPLTDFLECDAASPSTVMGMGNPAAPDGEVPGSGDTFDHQKPTAKTKRRKKDVRTSDKKPQEDIVQPATEGLLDADFGMDDSFDSAIMDTMIDKFAEVYNNTINLNEQQYIQFYEQFRSVAKAASQQFNGMSMMKAFRSKEHVIISFKAKTTLHGKTLSYDKGIEIRRFVKNPLPWAVEIAWCDVRGYAVSGSSLRCNHPTTMNLKLWEAYICPVEIWDKLVRQLNYNPFPK